MCRVILLHIGHSRRSRLPRRRPCASASSSEPSWDPIRFSCLDYIPLLNQRIAMIRPIRTTILDPILIYREPAIHGQASMMVCSTGGLVNMVPANLEWDSRDAGMIGNLRAGRRPGCRGPAFGKWAIEMGVRRQMPPWMFQRLGCFRSSTGRTATLSHFLL